MSAARKWDDLGSLAYEIQKTESRPEALLLVALWGDRDGWTPRTQYEVAGRRIDVAIPEAKIAIEADGHEWHSTNEKMEDDLERQNILVEHGWTPLRYSAKRSFLTTGQCAVRALREIKKRIRAPGDVRRPNPPQRDPGRGTPKEDRAATMAALQAFKDAMAASAPIDENGYLPRPGRRA